MTIPTFTLRSASTNGAAPFTLGHAFKQGDVPAGAQLVGSIPNLQVVAKNAWPDGSLKFAIVSGRAPLTANVPLSVTLSIGTPAGGTALTLADLKATGVSASIAAGAFGTVSWAGADWDSPWQSWVSGPQMSSWIYRKQVGSDAHLVGFLEVRLFAGGAVEVLPWIENGYLLVAGPTNKSATYTFTLGTQRFSAALDVKHHTRTPLISGTALSYWLAADPQVTPRHDVAYMQDTELVPSYSASTTTGALSLGGIAASASYVPFQQGNFDYSDDSMPGTGYSGAIGLLPLVDVAYLTCTDSPEALYGAVVRNGFSAGRYPIHYRDEASNRQRPIRFSDHANLGLSDGSGFKDNGGAISFTPATSGGGRVWDTAHAPSVGYMAYLVTGRWYFMEQVQFAAGVDFLGHGSNVELRDGAKGLLKPEVGAWQTRSAAWGWRTLAQALSVTPDADTGLRADYVASMQHNIDNFHTDYVANPGNDLGIVRPGEGYGDGFRYVAIWQQDFLTATMGYSLSMNLPVSSAHKTKLVSLFQWKAKSAVFRLGPSDEFWYINAAPYTLNISSVSNPSFTNNTGPWLTEAQAYHDTFDPATRYTGTAYDWVGSTEGTLAGISHAAVYWVREMWGNLHPAIAYAVRHGVPGAAEGYARMTGASNYAALQTNFNNYPVWSVEPLTAQESEPTMQGPGYLVDSARVRNDGYVVSKYRRGVPQADVPVGALGYNKFNGAPAGTPLRIDVRDASPYFDMGELTDWSFAGAPDGIYSMPLDITLGGEAHTGLLQIDVIDGQVSTVTGVSISPSSASIAGLATQQFTGIVTGTNSPSQAGTWSKVSGVGTVSMSGLYTAPAATSSAQTAVLRFRSDQDTSYYADVTVTIAASSAPPASTVTGVTISPSSAAIAGGATQQFSATVLGTNSPSQAGTWTKVSGVGTVSTGGLYTAPAATGSAQSAVLRFTSQQDTDYSADVTVTIAASGTTPTPVVSSVDVTPATRTMSGGSSYQFSAVANGTNNPAQTFNWSITAGTVNASGYVTAPPATTSIQTLTLTATHTVDTNRSDTATITVPALVVIPDPDPDVGERTVEVTIIAIDQQGQRMAAAPITITLDRADVDEANGYVTPEALNVESDENGIAIVRLWPNSRGTLGSQYEVKIVNPDTGKTMRVKAVIPDADCFLHRVALPPEQ